jgi:hypothetical protein
MLSESPQSPQSQTESIHRIYRMYASLASTLPAPLDAQSGLGGKLLYAGDMGEGRDLLFAANIAGAASLAASADPLAQRQAIRDGVVDFVVTSLEEALRILKNEIRKRQTVSVAVAVDPELLVEQMLDRGVLPDLLPVALSEGDRVQLGKFLADGALRIALPVEEGAFVPWSVDHEFARWLPRLDACVQRVLPSEDSVRQRWLRLAPRYLGRLAQRRRGVVLSAPETKQLRDEVLRLLADHAQDSGGVPVVEIDGQRV